MQKKGIDVERHGEMFSEMLEYMLKETGNDFFESARKSFPEIPTAVLYPALVHGYAYAVLVQRQRNAEMTERVLRAIHYR